MRCKACNAVLFERAPLRHRFVDERGNVTVAEEALCKPCRDASYFDKQNAEGERYNDFRFELEDRESELEDVVPALGEYMRRKRIDQE